MAYRVIACSVGDYGPDMTLDEILLLDEFDQDYFRIEQAETIEQARGIAARQFAEWFAADIDLLIGDNDNLNFKLEMMPDAMAAVAKISEGEAISTYGNPRMSSSSDWVRIEEV
jgi:hypothetical protein